MGDIFGLRSWGFRVRPWRPGTGSGRRSMLSQLLSNRPKARPRPTARPRLEALESRELLRAAAIVPEFFANVVNGVTTPAAFGPDSYGGPPRVAVAADAAGNFVVVWSSFINNESFPGDSDVYAQRFDAVGNPLGTAFQV